jgi:hypothetical protein
MAEKKKELSARKTAINTFILFFVTFCCPLSPTGAQDNAPNVGTLIGAYANKNGIVVVTDSQLSVLGENGQPIPIRQPGQKLAKLDDRHVVAVAGLEFLPVETMPSLSADTLGVIVDYRRNLEGDPRFDDLLRGISATLQFYLTTITDIKIKTKTVPRETISPVEIILAGYDLDGTPKIGKIVIKYSSLSPGGEFVATEVVHESIGVGEDFVYKTAGIDEIAQAMLKKPLRGKYNPPALETYWSALERETRNKLTIEQMSQLGDSLINETFAKTNLVGGLAQVASLRNNQVQSLSPTDVFPALRTPFPLVVMKGAHFEGGGQLVHNNSGVIFFDHGYFRGNYDQVAEPYRLFSGMHLDGNIYVNSTFNNLLLVYDGGEMYFDSSNTTNNCHIQFGPNVTPEKRNYYTQMIVH